jgi:hypothetical protein
MSLEHAGPAVAAEKQSYACDTFTGHGKAHQSPRPGSPVRVFPVMLLGKADEGAAGIPCMPGLGRYPYMSARGY